MLGGVYFFRDSVVTPISSVIISIGLDLTRTQFVVALLMTMAASLIGGLLGRRKSGTMVGAGIVFWFGYLARFIQDQLAPAYDQGYRQLLHSQVLFSTALKMIGLALLCGLIGAAVGTALAEVVLDPCYELLYSIWRYFAHRRPGWQEVAEPEIIAPVRLVELPLWERIVRTLGQWLGIAVVIVSLVLASNSVELFQGAPDVGVHTLPSVSTPGTLTKGTLVSSALGGLHKDFLIYLPHSYNTQKTKHYPVIYLLHGVPGNEYDWKRYGNIIEYADILIAKKTIPDLIMVMPDGNGLSKVPPEWADSVDHHQLMETYVVRDLVQYIDQHYRTIPDAAHRAIGGLSMGGFGAMNIAEHHPNVFGSVISLGGYYYYAEGDIWKNNTPYMRANSPMITFPKNKAAWKLHIYLGAATKDQPYYSDTKDFTHLLRKLHIPYSFDLERGYHSWAVWQRQMYYVLQWLKWG